MLHARSVSDGVPVSFDEATVLAEFPEATPALARMVAELRMTDAFLRDPAKAPAPDIRQGLEARLLELHREITSFNARTIPDIQLKDSMPANVLTTSGVDRRALVAYASWLHSERAHVCRELYPSLGWKAATFIVGDNAGFDYHRSTTPAASTRAERVLALVGCDWSGDSYLGVGDTQEPARGAPDFPHPDARLMDLERDWQAAREIYDDVRAREDAALAEFHGLEEAFDGAEDGLLMYPPEPGAVPGTVRRHYWQGKHIRQIVAGRFIPATARDAERVDATPRAEFERLLPLVEAREARRNALSERLNLQRLETEGCHAFDVTEEAAKRIYRQKAVTFEGLAIKVRVLRTQEPELWKRPKLGEPAVALEPYERALIEIADGVDHLLTLRPVEPSLPSLNDPIFAAIDEGWRLTREHGRLLAICGDKPETHPSWEPADEAHDAMWAFVDDVLIKTVPQTAEGCRALARFAYDFTEDQGVPVRSGDDGNRCILDLIARSPLSSAAVEGRPNYDLRGASFSELQAFAGVVELVSDMMAAICCQPRTEDFPSANGFARWIYEVTDFAITAVREEATHRIPKGDHDRLIRLKLLARPVIENGDKAEISALARDVAELVEA